ncbi:hypothetical protein L3Y34_004017 [Caenorhabditis briggsae]|uniref:Uncharacterized protein n=2 Tax=Caenorhabditis briggsae TaxID=6238 RepID=A0AAE9ACU8_CAEBR|nr:hypothetical protein L3Y34_004017 [Caenorhabditis briggsae]
MATECSFGVRNVSLRKEKSMEKKEREKKGGGIKIFREYQQQEREQDQEVRSQMGDYQLHQSRNLSVTQTLDEILGISLRTEQSTASSSSNSNEKNALNSPCRPPTRHGRESSGSNEENKDPVYPENGGNHPTLPTFPGPTSSSTRRRSEDDFFKKLNQFRKGSLVSTMDDSSTPSTTVNAISIHPDSPNRESRPRLEIHVEESIEDVPQSASNQQKTFLSENSRSTSTEQEDPSLTFRVDIDEDKEEPKKKPESKLKNILKKPPKDAPKPKPRSKTPVVEKEKSLEQMSMFNSKLNKPSDAHHKEWLQKKEREIRERKAKEKAIADQKAASEKERRENSAKLYQRWVQDHDEKMKEMKRLKQKREKEKAEKEKYSKDQKLKEADKNYEMWKRERSKSVTDIKKKLEEESEKKKKREEDLRNEKIKEAQKAFLAWKQKKEEFLNDEARQQKKEKEEKREEETESQLKRMELANEAYETWIQLKETEREMIADLVLIEAPPIPWIPPSNLVPRQFLRSAGGSRPRAARSQSAKSIAKRTRSRPSTTTSAKNFAFFL